MFSPASSRTVPFFHRSSLRAPRVVSTALSEVCSNPDGASGGAGVSCVDTALGADCETQTATGEKNVATIKTECEMRIGCVYLLSQIESTRPCSEGCLRKFSSGRGRHLRH